jgi:hypothetical protein
MLLFSHHASPAGSILWKLKQNEAEDAIAEDVVHQLLLSHVVSTANPSGIALVNLPSSTISHHLPPITHIQSSPILQATMNVNMGVLPDSPMLALLVLTVVLIRSPPATRLADY